MKNQIVIVCSEDGTILGLKYDESVINLSKGENVLTVTEIPELAYGFAIFDNGEYIESIDLSDYDTSKVKDMSYMFAGCSNLKSLDINLNTSNVTNMSGMFYSCESLEEIHFHQFDTSKVDGMEDMFGRCLSLKHLNLNHFNTSNVRCMNWMFGFCSALETLDVSSFDTSKADSMGYMFASCYSLKTLNLRNFNTSNVKDMEAMFCGCSALTTLDLSNFNTSNVRDMEAMFCDCKALMNLNISSFDFSQTMRKRDMFRGCKEGIGIDLNTIKFNPEMIIDDDMKKNGMKYQIGGDYCYEIDSIFGIIAAKGIVVYNNGIVAVTRVWYGNFEMLASLDADDYTYTQERIAQLFNDFTDDHCRFQCEAYLLIDLKTDKLVPSDMASLYTVN